jgi:uncharacterized protein (TIGR02117 family)
MLIRALLAGLAAIALATLCAVALYLLAALIGALWQVNRDRIAPSSDGIEIWLRSNGVHVELVLPVDTAAHDWRAMFPPRTFAAGPADARWIAFGWGARDFFVHVREWKHLTFGRAARALALAPSVLHVEYLPGGEAAMPPAMGRRLEITAAEHRRLIVYVVASVERDPSGQPQLLAGLGYHGYDNFYAARGRYSPIATCNEWTNSALKQAGIRAPAWSPFAIALVR